MRYCNVERKLKELGLPDLLKALEGSLKRVAEKYGVDSYEYISLSCDIVLYEGEVERK